jgi:signal transduction histidine kinase
MTGATRSSAGQRLLTPRTFTTVGLLTGAYCLYALVTSSPTVAPTVSEPVLEFLLLGVPAVGHLFTGYWLQTGGFSDDDVWRIGYAATAGALVAAATTVVVVPAVVGTVPSFDGAVFLLVGTGTEGAFVGTILAALWLPSVPVGRYDGESTTATVGEPGLVSTEALEEAVDADLTNGSTGATASTEDDDPVAPNRGGETERLQTLHSLVRHDVRNSLNVIGGRLDLLTATTDGLDETHLDAIESQQQAVLDLLEDVEVAVEAVSSEEELDEVPLASVVSEEVDVIRDTYDDVTVDVDVPDVTVRADELLTHVLENVLSNAVKHHDREEPEITVTADADTEEVRLRVADDGPGIPDRLGEEVFEPEVGDGTGMGLYLVETLVTGYGGSVSLEDNDPRGTVVEITLRRVSEESADDEKPVVAG